MPAVQHDVVRSAWCIKSRSQIGKVTLLICEMLTAELLVRSVQHFMLYLRLGNHITEWCCKPLIEQSDVPDLIARATNASASCCVMSSL